MRFLLVLALLLATASPLAAQDYYFYIAAESEDAVELIHFDGDEARIAKRIPVGFYPTENEGAHGLTVSPDGAYWYLSLAHGQPYGYLLKYATGTDELVAQTTLGLFPATMSISPATGLLYAVNFNLHGLMEPSTVSVVDVETMTEITQVETGVMPHGSRLSADGLKHYSAAMMSGMLYEIDAQTLEMTRELYVGEPMADAEGMDHHGDHSGHDMSQMQGREDMEMSMHDAGMPSPTWVAPHPSEPKVYVANNGSDEIVEVDTEAWAVTRRFAAAGRPYNVAVSPDGALLVATYKGEGAVGLWDLASGEEVARLPTTRTVTHGVVISPDGRYAFATSEGKGGEPGAVDVFDLAAQTHVAALDVGKQAGGIAFWKMDPSTP